MTEKSSSNAPLLIKAFESAKSSNYDDLLHYINDYPDELNAVIPKEYYSVVDDPDLTGGRTLLMVLAKFQPTSPARAVEYVPILHAMQPYVDPNKRSDSGATAPMFAAHNGNITALSFFANWPEVDWNKRSEKCFSAYDFAADGFHAEALKMLAKEVPEAVTVDTAWLFLKQKLTEVSPARRREIAVMIERTLYAIEAVSKQTTIFEQGMSILDQNAEDEIPDINTPFL